MMDENSFLADDNTLSRISGDDQDEYGLLDPHQSLEDDLYISPNDSSTTSGDEDDEDDQIDINPGDMDETISPT